MVLRITGKNIDIGDALRAQVQTRVGEALSKYFDGGFSGQVTVMKDGSGFKTECLVHLDSGMDLQATGASADAYASFDQAAERLEKRLRRYKRRLKDHHVKNGHSPLGDMPNYVIAAPSEEEDDHEEGYPDGSDPVVIAETSVKLRAMPVSAAVMELDLTGAPVVVFRNAGTGRLNIVYRRLDSNIGWIDPPAPSERDH